MIIIIIISHQQHHHHHHRHVIIIIIIIIMHIWIVSWTSSSWSSSSSSSSSSSWSTSCILVLSDFSLTFSIISLPCSSSNTTLSLYLVLSPRPVYADETLSHFTDLTTFRSTIINHHHVTLFFPVLLQRCFIFPSIIATLFCFSTDGCPNSCNNNGKCQLFSNSWKCSCRDGWKGFSCEVAMEVICDSNMDEDRGRLLVLTSYMWLQHVRRPRWVIGAHKLYVTWIKMTTKVHLWAYKVNAMLMLALEYRVDNVNGGIRIQGGQCRH